MVKCLITSGADINAVNNVSCTYFCFYHCNHNLLYTIQDNVTPLHYASLQGHCSIVEYLITSGADINAVNHVSCIFCFHSYIIIRFNLYTIQGNRTPLHYASREGRCSTVEYLIASGADINAVTNVNCIFCF